MITIEVRSALLVPQSIKHAVPAKTKNNIGKIDKHYTNCGMTNHMWRHAKIRKSRP
jgi:hypothetical protein